MKDRVLNLIHASKSMLLPHVAHTILLALTAPFSDLPYRTTH